MAAMAPPPVSPVKTNRPELRVEAAAINDEPVELDGTPTTPTRLRARVEGQNVHAAQDAVPISEEEKQKLAKMISERKSDPAVLVDLPQTPQAEELAVAGSTDEMRK